MAKRNKAKFASKSRKSALRVEALEQRQLLAAVTGGGTEVGSNIVHPNGNVYDQVLMTGSSVTVTADAGQVTRVSFLDLSGDIVQAEFSGKGSLTVSLDQSTLGVTPSNYNQAGIKYSQGLASFTIQGEDASTNFQVFSVGKGNAVNQALFDSTHNGGNSVADVARLVIVADPTSPNGSAMGLIGAGNAIFADSSGVVGISAVNVAVQGKVIVGDIASTNSGVPTLKFGANSQFATLTIAGGSLTESGVTTVIQTSGFTNINSQAGTTSAGTTLKAQVFAPSVTFSDATIKPITLDSTSSFDLTNMGQSDIDAAFKGRTFTGDVTINGDLASNFTISASDFRGNVTFGGKISGTVTVDNGIKNLTLSKGLFADLKATSIGNITSGANIEGNVTAKSIGDVTITGDLKSKISTDYSNVGTYDLGEKAIGKVNVSGNMSGQLVGVLGIGNVTIGGNLTGNSDKFTTVSDLAGINGDAFTASIGTIAVTGDINIRKNSSTVNPVNLITLNRGTYGNITVGGAGTQNASDLSVTNYLGGVKVNTALTSKSGSITVTDDASLELGEVKVAGTSSLGDISLTSGSKAQTTNSLGGVVAGNSIVLDTSTASGSSFAMGALTLSGAETITFNALTARTVGAISATTIDTANAKVTLSGDIAGTSSVGAVTLNAGTKGSVAWSSDIGG